jgi:hypothetical protein
VLLNSLFKVCGKSSIEGIIRKLEDVDVKHKNIVVPLRPTSLCFAGLRGTHFLGVGLG